MILIWLIFLIIEIRCQIITKLSVLLWYPMKVLIHNPIKSELKFDYFVFTIIKYRLMILLVDEFYLYLNKVFSQSGRTSIIFVLHQQSIDVSFRWWREEGKIWIFDWFSSFVHKIRISLFLDFSSCFDWKTIETFFFLQNCLLLWDFFLELFFFLFPSLLLCLFLFCQSKRMHARIKTDTCEKN